MRSLSDIFRRTKKSAALIPFITAGFPRLGSTPELMRALVAGGADIIEIGVPFSDPMADGVAIQRAGERALKNGMTLPRILAQVGEFREENKETPLVLMGYANSFLNFGREKFGAAAAAAGVDGVIIVDLADADRTAWREELSAHGAALIPLLAPTTTAARRAHLLRDCGGYVYYISLRGITGAAHLDTAPLAGEMADIRRHTSVPVAVGFGVRTAKQAAAVAAVADGVVVGSRLTEILTAAEESAKNPPAVAAEEFMRELSKALQK